VSRRAALAFSFTLPREVVSTSAACASGTAAIPQGHVAPSERDVTLKTSLGFEDVNTCLVLSTHCR
jgi:hypothetical protein